MAWLLSAGELRLLLAYASNDKSLRTPSVLFDDKYVVATNGERLARLERRSDHGKPMRLGGVEQRAREWRAKLTEAGVLP